MFGVEVCEKWFKVVLVMRPQSKGVINISPPHRGFEGGRAKRFLLQVFHVDVGDNRGEG